jgi:hypothetical protein
MHQEPTKARSPPSAATSAKTTARTVASSGLAVTRAAADVKAKATGALRRLQRLPHLVRAFFADPNLRYITTRGPPTYIFLTRSESGEVSYAQLTQTDMNGREQLHHDQQILYFRRPGAGSPLTLRCHERTFVEGSARTVARLLGMHPPVRVSVVLAQRRPPKLFRGVVESGRSASTSVARVLTAGHPPTKENR